VRPRLPRRNNLRRARRNIAYHYDLGNELFAHMLDETMTYSCAVFAYPDEPLEEAQRRKLRRVCDKLALGPDDHVLEIGCGWGSFALVAAGEYGARVTGVTISAEQAALARERLAAAGLEGRVEILERDYRLVEGSFTKVASIEMLEAIGEDQWRDYFATIDRLLAPGGSACIQTILVPDQRFARYRATPDWIERYVFPGCLIPSLAALAPAIAGASTLSLYGIDEIGPHYADTLREWRRRFHASRPRLREIGYRDRRFERVWEFYLASCEACFRTHWLRDAQLLLARSDAAPPG
jgi:cyclopropane-fatty-acyl-phospholipid synthase